MAESSPGFRVFRHCDAGHKTHAPPRLDGVTTKKVTIYTQMRELKQTRDKSERKTHKRKANEIVRSGRTTERKATEVSTVLTNGRSGEMEKAEKAVVVA
jgi:hypothetical protein